jgi:glycosyltransferase involved in cell wall biosynthesis
MARSGLECRRSLGLPEDAFIVSSQGFVTPPKRLPVVLAAFKRLLKLVPNARYVIVGEDHWQWKIAPLIEELGLRNQVRLTGYVTEQGLLPLSEGERCPGQPALSDGG